MYFQTDHEKRVGIKKTTRKNNTQSLRSPKNNISTLHVKVESRGAKVTESMA